MTKIILLNKPFNVLCQFRDKDGRATLADYIDEKGVYPAGRLDYDSEGLLLLTDDGKLQHQISHPEAKLEKCYWAQIEGEPGTTELQALRKGINLNDGRCRPAKVSIIEQPSTLWQREPPIRTRKSIPTSWLHITISEGRNRQVRRMTAAIGYPTLRLIRAKIGNWSLEQLQPGESRTLNIPITNNRTTTDRHTTKRRRRL